MNEAFRWWLAGMIVCALGCEARLSLGTTCTRSSECSAGLVCGVGGRCRAECVTSRDCSLGARCLRDQATGVNACSLGTTDACAGADDCAAGLRCLDGACVNLCDAADDCPDGVCVELACEPVIAGADAGVRDDAGAPRCAALPAPDDRIVDVSMGDDAACAVAASGGVWCWGYWPFVFAAGGPGCGEFCTETPQRVLSSDGTPLSATDVVVGSAFGCAILADATVRCWGDVDGHGGIDARAQRVLREVDGLPLSGATALVAGRHHACALVGTEAWCWGRNAPGGVLGDGTTTDRALAAPATALGADVRALAAAFLRTFSVSGTPQVLVGVGEDDQGELGGAAATPAPGWAVGAVTSTITDFDVLAPGGDATCILRAGAPLCWGSGALLGAPAAASLEGCGGSCTTSPRPIEVELSTPLVGLVADFAGASALGWSADGTLFGWGSNEGQVLDPSTVRSTLERAVPLSVTGVPPTHVVSLGSHGACVVADDTGELWCWGMNGAGQLGRGTVTPSEASAERPCWPEP